MHLIENHIGGTIIERTLHQLITARRGA